MDERNGDAVSAVIQSRRSAAKDLKLRRLRSFVLATGGVVSVQVLNEFVSVARRKLGMPWEEVSEALAAIRALCPDPVPVTLETHEAALRIAEKHGYSISDALIAAAALLAGCRTLYSEDLQAGQRLDGRLTIVNPFV